MGLCYLLIISLLRKTLLALLLVRSSHSLTIPSGGSDLSCDHYKGKRVTET